jgi:hypothetical protein
MCDMLALCNLVNVNVCQNVLLFLMQYISMYEIKKSIKVSAHFFTKTRVKFQRTQISKGKIARAMSCFHNKVNTVNCSSRNRGRVILRFEITR